MRNNRGLFLKRFDSINMGLSALMVFGVVISLIDSIFGRGVIYNTTQYIYLLFFINALPALLKNFSLQTFFLILAVWGIYLFSILIRTNSVVFDEAQRTILLWCMPGFLLASCVTDFEKLFKWLRLSSIIILLITIMQLFFVFSSEGFFYSQELGYSVLPCLALFYLSFEYDRKFYYLVPVIISFIVILASGSRGPLLSGILAIVLCYVSHFGLSKKIMILGVLVITCSFLFANYIVDLLTSVLSYFGNLNFSTRTIELLLSGNIADDDERTNLRSIAINYILNHPFYGTGVVNDRVIIAQSMGSAGINVYGSYCHNFILEIMMQFGMLPGGIILVLFVKKIINMLRSRKVFIVKIGVFTISVGLFPLLVSRSWITYPEFYLLMGIIISSLNLSKKHGVYKN